LILTTNLYSQIQTNYAEQADIHIADVSLN